MNVAPSCRASARNLPTVIEARCTHVRLPRAPTRWPECDEAELRADALSAIYDSLEPVAGALAQCLDTLVADKLSVDALRGFPHPRAERDLANELPSRMVDDMLG